MAIRFQCPAPCGKVLTARDESAGQVVVCPVCGQRLGVPSPAMAAPAAARGMPAAGAEPPMARPVSTHSLSRGAAGPQRYELRFAGTSGELGQVIVHGLLALFLTGGLYLPWLVASMVQWTAQKTTYGRTTRGDVRFEFQGTGLDFVKLLLYFMLAEITLFFWLPQFVDKLIRFWTENTVGVAEDGTVYRLRFQGTAEDLRVAVLKGFWLSILTFGLYLPWFACSVLQVVADKTEPMEDGRPAGRFEFDAHGRDALPGFLRWVLLCAVTFGLAAAWAMVAARRFLAKHLRIAVDGVAYRAHYRGKGGDLLAIGLKWAFALPFTLMLTTPRAIVEQVAYECEHVVVETATSGDA